MEKPKLFVPVMEIGANSYTMHEVKEYESVHMIGYEEYQFVIHQHVDIGDNNDKESWVVTEVSTGAKIAEDKLKVVALKYAQANLSSVTKQKFAEMITNVKIQSDLARERTIVYKIHDQVAGRITKEEIKNLLLNKGLEITDVIDMIVETNGLIGVGLISLGNDLKDYCHKKIKNAQ